MSNEIQYLDCESHVSINDGDYDVCKLHKFRTEYDCYDTFLKICEYCKSHNKQVDFSKIRGIRK